MLSIFLLLCSAIAVHSEFDPRTHRNWNLLRNRYCDKYITERVDGVETAGLKEYPWIARLIMDPDKTFGCIGTILNKDFILTSAQCAIGEKNAVKEVVLGDYNTNSDPDCDDCANVQTIEVEAAYHHKNNKDGFQAPYDIALLKLKKEIEFNANVHPICVPKGHLMTEKFANYNSEAVGWKMRATPITRRKLQKVNLRVKESGDCKKYFSSYDDDFQMCAGSAKEGEMTCFGDPGGPLMIGLHDTDAPIRRVYLIGISAHETFDNCGKTSGRNASVFTRVNVFMEWILDNLIEVKN